jgi:hypothetical protein
MQIVENNGQESSGSQILHPGSRKLFCHWEALRAERPCPTREEFSPADVRDIMADLVVLERDHMRKSFRYRLAGTRVCDLHKANLTGADALAGWDVFEKDLINRHLVQTAVNFQPTLLRTRLTTDTRQQVAVEFIGLPVRMRGSERIEIMGGVFPFRPAQNLGHNGIAARELLAIRSVWTEYQEDISNRPSAPPRRFAVIEGGMN